MWASSDDSLILHSSGKTVPALKKTKWRKLRYIKWHFYIICNLKYLVTLKKKRRIKKPFLTKHNVLWYHLLPSTLTKVLVLQPHQQIHKFLKNTCKNHISYFPCNKLCLKTKSGTKFRHCVITTIFYCNTRAQMHLLVKIYAAPWVCERMFWFANLLSLWLANFHLHWRQKNTRNELDYINLSGSCRSQPHGSFTLILKVTTL